MKSDDERAEALAVLWKDAKRKIGGRQSSAWAQEGVKGRMQGIEDSAHAVGLFAKFKARCEGRAVKDLPGQMMLGDVPGFLNAQKTQGYD